MTKEILPVVYWGNKVRGEESNDGASFGPKKHIQDHKHDELFLTMVSQIRSPQKVTLIKTHLELHAAKDANRTI